MTHIFDLPSYPPISKSYRGVFCHQSIMSTIDLFSHKIGWNSLLLTITNSRKSLSAQKQSPIMSVLACSQTTKWALKSPEMMISISLLQYITILNSRFVKDLLKPSIDEGEKGYVQTSLFHLQLTK